MAKLIDIDELADYLRLRKQTIYNWLHEGKISGIKANHIWRLEPRDGKTIVRTEESWEGLVTRIFRARMQRTLQNAIDSGPRHLKAEAERRPTH